MAECLKGNSMEAAVEEGILSDWARHTDAIVLEVVGTDLLATRLRELGVLPGVRLRVLRTGNSLIVQLDEGRFAIRRRDAAAVRVCAPPARPDADADVGLRPAPVRL